MPNPKLIIFQGDDSDFLDQTNRWYLPAREDYASFSARYSVGHIVKDAEIKSDSASGETKYYVELVLSAADTAALPPGEYIAALKLYDEQGRCQTVNCDTVIKVLPQEVNNDGI